MSSLRFIVKYFLLLSLLAWPSQAQEDGEIPADDSQNESITEQEVTTNIETPAVQQTQEAEADVEHMDKLPTLEDKIDATKQSVATADSNMTKVTETSPEAGNDVPEIELGTRDSETESPNVVEEIPSDVEVMDQDTINATEDMANSTEVQDTHMKETNSTPEENDVQDSVTEFQEIEANRNVSGETGQDLKMEKNATEDNFASVLSEPAQEETEDKPETAEVGPSEEPEEPIAEPEEDYTEKPEVEITEQPVAEPEQNPTEPIPEPETDAVEEPKPEPEEDPEPTQESMTELEENPTEEPLTEPEGNKTEEPISEPEEIPTDVIKESELPVEEPVNPDVESLAETIGETEKETEEIKSSQITSQLAIHSEEYYFEDSKKDFTWRIKVVPPTPDLTYSFFRGQMQALLDTSDRKYSAQLSYDGEELIFTIENLNVEDFGEYSVQVESSHAKASTSTTLIVKSPPKIYNSQLILETDVGKFVTVSADALAINYQYFEQGAKRNLEFTWKYKKEDRCWSNEDTEILKNVSYTYDGKYDENIVSTATFIANKTGYVIFIAENEYGSACESILVVGVEDVSAMRVSHIGIVVGVIVGVAVLVAIHLFRTGQKKRAGFKLVKDEEMKEIKNHSPLV